MRARWRVVVAGLLVVLSLAWAGSFASVGALDAAPDVRVEADRGLVDESRELAAPPSPILVDWHEHPGLGAYGATPIRPREWGS
jgi:hypothetical protein